MSLEQAAVMVVGVLASAVVFLYAREQKRVSRLEEKVEVCERSHTKAIEDRARMWEAFYQISAAIKQCPAAPCPNKGLQYLMPSRSIDTPPST